MNKKKPGLILPDNDNLVLPHSITKEPEKVFLGIPTRDGKISAGSAQSAMIQVTQNRLVMFRVGTHTNLELNYNMLLCDALNFRDRDGIKWFAMLHDDIQTEPYWVDILIDEAEKYHADFMSAHVPLKDSRRMTSTALSDPNDPWCPYVRLGIKQIHHADFPETIDTQMALKALDEFPEPYKVICPTDSQLLINTGCMVMRLDKPWMERICFHKRDEIVFAQGMWQPMSWTEDWVLAEDLHAVDAKVMATRKVKLAHWDGKQFWPSENDGSGQNVDESTIGVRVRRENYHKELKLV